MRSLLRRLAGAAMTKMPALAVIAVDRYLQWTRLANPVRDARAIGDLIVERCYVDEGCGLGFWIPANAGTDPAVHFERRSVVYVDGVR